MTQEDRLVALTKQIEDGFDERDKLMFGLFSLFSRVVDPRVLYYMGVPEFVCLDEPGRPWALPELRGFALEDWIDICGRAETFGIVSAAEQGNVYIERIVAQRLRRYLTLLPSSESLRTRAFIESVALRAHQFHRMRDSSPLVANRQIALNELNHLAALAIAVENRWSTCIISLLEALQVLARRPKRHQDWKRIMALVLPVFVDVETHAALSGQETNWPIIMSFQNQLFDAERNFENGGNRQQQVIDRLRAEASPWLDKERPTSPEGRHQIMRLANEIANLAVVDAQRGAVEVACRGFAEAYELAIRADKCSAQSIAGNLAGQYLKLGQFDEADRWFAAAEAIDLANNVRYLLGRAEVLLAKVRANRDEKKGDAERLSNDELSRLLAKAVALASDASDRSNKEDFGFLGHVHSVLGSLYGELKNFDRAIENYRRSLSYRRARGVVIEIARTEGNLAGVLEAKGERRAAISALERALPLFEQAGADDEAVSVRSYIDQIRSSLGKYKRMND